MYNNNNNSNNSNNSNYNNNYCFYNNYITVISTILFNDGNRCSKNRFKFSGQCTTEC